MVDSRMVPFDFEKVILECKEYSQNMSPKDLHHGFDHCLRVKNYAVEIAKSENADFWVVEIASYLHDVGRGHEKTEYHTTTSAKLANSLLRKLGLTEKETQRVVHCIETHSRKKLRRQKPQTIEAKVLYDADGLEMIGAIGMLRTGLSAQVQNKDWKHILKKAKWRLKIKNDFLTSSGKKIAKRREKLVTIFVNQLASELKQTQQQKTIKL